MKNILTYRLREICWGKKFLSNTIISSVIISIIFLFTNAQTYTEAEIKSAFICNFAKFTQWPAKKTYSDTSSIIIGIIGEDPYGDVLPKIAKSVQIDKRKLMVIKLKSLSELQNVHILFVGVTELNQLKNITELCVKNNILTISEIPEFTKFGGIINFSKEKARYGFEISQKNAEKSELILSAKLLKLATIVD